MSIPLQRLAASIDIPYSTARRRIKQKATLTANESDRLYRAARIFALAQGVLGKLEKATQWMNAPNRALGGEAPLDCLKTDIGVGDIEAILKRLEYGVFS